MTSVAISVFNVWSHDDRRAPLDIDLSNTNFYDSREGA